MEWGPRLGSRSRRAVALATIFEVFNGAADRTPAAEVLKSAIEEASQRVHGMHTSEVALGRPGSTVVAVLMHAQGTTSLTSATAAPTFATKDKSSG